MNTPDVSPAQVQKLLADGADSEAVVELLVATGTWTEDGATEIVSTLAPTQATAAEDSGGWPGPIEEVPPPLGG
jgi:hypothetical protein